MPRYHAVYRSMRSGGYTEFTADDDEAALADALAKEATNDKLVSLSEIRIGLVDQLRTIELDDVYGVTLTGLKAAIQPLVAFRNLHLDIDGLDEGTADPVLYDAALALDHAFDALHSAIQRLEEPGDEDDDAC